MSLSSFTRVCLNMLMEKRTDRPHPDSKAHSASANVYIMDAAFPVPQLGRTRRIWLYLPAGYFSGSRHYPVLYMHDGQNLFDAQTSYAGEWGVDEILDAMQAPCIVAGIDNGGQQRMQEYNVHDHPQFGKGEGEAYLKFIVKTLKPFIDTHYRTLPAQRNTFVAGSSMGGLISYYAGLYYPKVFGAVGILSPSFWILPEPEAELKQLTRRRKYSAQKYFFSVGSQESPVMIKSLEEVAALMKQLTKADIRKRIAPDGQHNEASWGQVFPEFFRWIMDK